GRQAFVFLQQDWRSNLETVEIEGPQPAQTATPSLSVEALGELAERSRAPHPLPSFAKRAGTPDTPADGLALSVSSEEDTLVAAGSFRLRAPAHARLSRDLSDWLRVKAGKNPVPSALVRVTLLVLVRDEPTPRTHELLVPVYEEQ